MMDRRITNICILIFVTLQLLAGIPAFAAPRVAVIAVDGDDAPKIAPLVEISLEKSGLTLVERAHLDQVIHEQKLQALLSADSPGARAKLGQLLNADFLVFISCPDKPTRRLEVITCETTQGIRLARTILPRADSAAKDADAANQTIAKAIAKSAKAGLKLIAVAPWNSDDLTTQFDYRRAAFRRLVEAPLADRDDIILVEFAEAEALKTELAIAGQPNLVRKGPMILSGKMKHSSFKPDAQVTVSLELTWGNQTLGTWSSGRVEVAAAAKALPGAAVDLVNKATGENPAVPPKLQAKELCQRGDDLLAQSFFADAAEMYEAALLLDPDNFNSHAGAMRALASEIRWEVAEAERGVEDPGARGLAAQQARLAFSPHAKRCMEHFEYVVERTRLDWQKSLDFYFSCMPEGLSVQVILDVNYNILKYKKDHRIDDQYIHLLSWFIDGSPDTEAEKDRKAEYLTRLTDVCLQQSNVVFIVEKCPDASAGSRRLESMLSHMDHSDNPAAVAAAKQVRAHLAATGNVAGIKPAPPAPPPATKPAVANVVPDFDFVRMKLPLQDLMGDVAGWCPAGPHADVMMENFDQVESIQGEMIYHVTRQVAHFFRDDGFARNLGSFVGGPAFDGKYFWWGTNEDNIAVIHVYDPERDKIWTAGAAQGVPADTMQTVALAGVSPGKVAIAASADAPSPQETPDRTWVAIATMDPSAGPSCNVILECREGAIAAHAAKLHTAFEPNEMHVMPGPPGLREKATPHLYIPRGVLNGTLLVAPDTGRARIIDDEGGWKFRGVFVGGKLYRCDMTVWDPLIDKETTLPMPPGLNAPKARFEIGVTQWSGKVYFGTRVNQVAHFWSPQDQTAEKPLIARAGDPMNPDPDPLAYHLTSTSVFGLVAWSGRVHFLANNPNPSSQGVDFQSWLKKDKDVFHNPDCYWQQLRDDTDGSEQWYADFDAYLKYSDPSSRDRGKRAMDVANDLMSDGNYDRAARYAAEAAKCKAEWALQCQVYATEGQGDWKRAEQLIRGVGDLYSDSRQWLMWCVRTGHGDLAGAQAHYAASINKNATDAVNVKRLAILNLLTGDDTKAQPLLQRLYKENHDPWACLAAADYAVSHGDNAARDRAFAAAPSTDETDRPICWLAQTVAEDVSANKPLDLDRVNMLANMATAEQPAGGTGPDGTAGANVYYFAGRFLILQGKTDLGIGYLKRAAGWNSDKTGRTLAALYLRNHHVPPPRPGMDR
jgi:tetratricopeptide (TPR) repeat protein